MKNKIAIALGIFAVGTVLAWSIPAWVRNGESLARKQCLVSVMAQAHTDASMSQPCLADPVVRAVWGSATDRTEIALDGMEQAQRVNSSYTEILDIVSPQVPGNPGLPWSLPTSGLAEYYALQAFEADDTGQSQAAVDLYQQALTYRVEGWAPRFYERYLAALKQTAPAVIAKLELEQAAPSNGAVQVTVGEKSEPGWDTAVPVRDGWQLVGYRLQSETALEVGVPLDLDLHWRDNSGREVSQALVANNLVPNGSFEFPPNATTPANIWGWWERTPDIRYLAIPQAQTVRNARGAVALLSQPGDEFPAKYSRIAPVTPDSELLWSAWIESENGAPHIFVVWYDANGQPLRNEIPMQGNATGAGRRYAGVLHVPADAAYLGFELVNLNAPGAVVWDDILCVALNVPKP